MSQVIDLTGDTSDSDSDMKVHDPTQDAGHTPGPNRRSLSSKSTPADTSRNAGELGVFNFSSIAAAVDEVHCTIATASAQASASGTSNVVDVYFYLVSSYVRATFSYSNFR